MDGQDNEMTGRMATLRREIMFQRRAGQVYGLILGVLVHVSFWGSIACSGVSAALALLYKNPTPAAAISLLSATAGGLIFAARQGKLEEWMLWHYRRSDAMNALRIRLDFELPQKPTDEDVAAISKDFRLLVQKMAAAVPTIVTTPQATARDR